MKALLVVGIILLVLFLLTLFSVRFDLKFREEEFFLSAGVLFLRFQLVPQKEKKKQKRTASETDRKKEITAQKPKEQSAETQQAQTSSQKTEPGQDRPQQAENKKSVKPVSEKRDWKETAAFVWDILRSVLRPTGFMLRHIRITGLQLHVIVGGEEPDETGIRFGHWNAAVYGGLAAVRNFMTVKSKKIMIAVDFTQPETTVEASCSIKVRIIVLLVSALRMIYHILVNTLKRNREHVGETAAAS